MGKIVYRPLPTAEKVHADTHTIQAIFGPWGCGKSTIAIYDLFFHCQKYPKCDCLIIRDTYPALKDSCLKDFLGIFRDAGEINMGPPPTFTWRIGEMKGQVMFRSAESPEDIQKFGSVQAGYVWIEEVCPGLMTTGATYQGIPQSLFAGIFARIRQAEVPRRMVITSLPPPSTNHWSYRLFYERRPVIEGLTEKNQKFLTDAIAQYTMTPEENMENLPENYYESLLSLLTTPDQIGRFIRGDVGSSYAGAAVYPGWNDLLHTKRKLEPFPGPIVRGWDGGLSPACVWFQLTPTGQCLVLAELTTENTSLEELAPVVQQVGKKFFGERNYTDYGDKTMFNRGQHDKRSCADIMRPLGIYLRPGVQDVPARIQAVRGWLSRMDATGARFLVHQRCERLIEGFRGAYKLKQVAGVSIDEPVKSHPYSDVHDALQHALAQASGMAPAVRIGPKQMPAGPFGALASGHKPLFPRDGFARRRG